eukprot:g8209.t1
MAATTGEMQGTIESRLTEALSPVHLEVINESHMHSGPAKESHFKVVVVSEEFEGKPLLARHRMVNALFAEEMKGTMHALSIQGKTPAQWEAEGHKVAPSPPCMGGSKADPSIEVPATALGATRQGATTMMTAQSRPPLRRRLPRPVGFGLLAVGMLAVCLCLPGGAAAVATGSAPAAKAGATPAKSVDLLAEVDKAFWRVADDLGGVVNRGGVGPMAQCIVMFHTAWMTTSVCPIACAGVLEQPLGRAMIATASSHAFFAALKFSMAAFALSSFPPIYVKATRRPGRSPGSSKPESNPAPKPATSRNKPPVRRPPLKLPSPLLPKRRVPATATAAGGDKAPRPVTRIQVRRSAKSVPKLWLMAVTAVGGPGVGAVGSAVAWKAGAVAIPAALSSLSRGSVLAVLAAGFLCYGGAGTTLVARWAVCQGVLGAPFAAALTPSALLAVYLCNYYWRAGKAKSRGNNGPGPAAGTDMVGAADKQKPKKADGSDGEEGGRETGTDDEREKD